MTTDLLRIERIAPEQLIEEIEDELLGAAEKRAASEKASDIASQSEQVSNSYGSQISVTGSTDELKQAQDNLDIAEETVRELQEEAGLSRLHHSRRQAFIKEILNDRIDTHAEQAVEAQRDEIRAEAESQVAELLEAEGTAVVRGWSRRDNGKAIGYGSLDWTSDPSELGDDQCQPDIRATVDAGVIALGEYDLPRQSANVVIPEGGASLTVEADVGTQEQRLEPGGYRIHCRSIQDLVVEAGLVEVEPRDAACTSSDKAALDIEIGRGDEENVAHVIDLKSGRGGYSSRRTKGWTEFRDFDPDRQMALITVGQASYYNGSVRGKQERTWLVGRDDGQAWCQQVHNTHETVEEALDFVTPAEVQNLEEQGREVIRQGDIFFVEMERSSNFEALEGTRHDVEETDGGFLINHPEHSDLRLDGKWKAVANNDGSHPGASGRSSRPGARD